MAFLCTQDKIQHSSQGRARPYMTCITPIPLISLLRTTVPATPPLLLFIRPLKLASATGPCTNCSFRGNILSQLFAFLAASCRFGLSRMSSQTLLTIDTKQLLLSVTAPAVLCFVVFCSCHGTVFLFPHVCDPCLSPIPGRWQHESPGPHLCIHLCRPNSPSTEESSRRISLEELVVMSKQGA